MADVRPPSIDELLAEARRGLERVEPDDLARAVADGALVVDIRPSELRSRDGALADAIVVDRNVLEWRLDPQSDHRLPEITSHGDLVVLVCDEGYASSLAARTLQTLGLRRATDLVGGFQGLRHAGLA